jgi:serine/threonine-protein kinase
MARVWAARQHGTRGFQKLVAIKTILPHLADDPEFERMFLDEAKIASGVHHPNVCEIYELGEEKRTLYLAMEWVNGDSFSRALRASGKTEAVDFGIAARVLADACAGAHAAHELEDDEGRKQGVVHRDLSPHNILINADGFTKVCDFGVAKALNQLHEATNAGQLKGKISYMSPEQVTGEPVDRRSDVFSLGCVLYESTTGKRPFRGEGDHNIMQAIVDGHMDPPSHVVRGYPADLERIVMRALAGVPNRRFASAELMRFALEEFLAKGPLVTQSQVAHLVRMRLGEMLERRRDRIKQASSNAEQESWSPASVPPSRDPVDHRSGVKPSTSGRATDSTSYGQVTTDQIVSIASPAAPMHKIGPSSSSTIPQVPLAIAEAQLTTETPQLGVKSASTPPSVRATQLMSPIGTESARKSVEAIGEAIKASLVPSPLDVAPMSGPPGALRSAIEARAMTQPGRDVPIPIMAPMEGPPSAMPSMPVPAGDPGEQPAGASYLLGTFIGLLFACAIGGGALYFWKTRQQMAIAPPVVTVAPAVSTAPAPSPEITLRVSSPEAVLIIDGNSFPKERRTVKRPSSGQMSSVIVHQPGFQDYGVQIDYFSPPAIDVTLKEADAGAAPATSAKKKPKPKEKDPTLPDNPY